MANTFNTSSPTNKDYVRIIIGDTATPWEFSDEEITMFLDFEGDDVRLASARAHETLATKSANSASSYGFSGTTSVSINPAPNTHRQLAKQLREEAKNKPFIAVNHFDYMIDDFGKDVSIYVGADEFA